MKKISKIMYTMYMMTSFVLLLSYNVNAYVDPSVMTYAIQAVAGIAIAIGAFVGIYFRKIKKNVVKKMGIDENKNKEVESDKIEIKK